MGQESSRFMSGDADVHQSASSYTEVQDLPASYSERHRLMVENGQYIDEETAQRVMDAGVQRSVASIEDGIGAHYDDSDSGSDAYGAHAPYESDSSEETSDSDDESESCAHTFLELERGLYAVRHISASGESGIAYVIAREEEPCAQFCHMLQTNEEEYAVDGEWSDVRAYNVPGAVTTFVREVLGERAGTPVPLAPEKVPSPPPPPPLDFDTRSKTPAPFVDDDPADVNEEVVHGVILNRADREYEYKMRTIVSVINGVSAEHALRTHTSQLKHRHMQRFNETGVTMNTADFYESPNSATNETNLSPVRDEEVWYVINLPYYYMYRSFRTLCERNARTLAAVARHVLAPSISSDGVCSTYVLGASDDYSAVQERAVLRRLLDRLQREDALQSGGLPYLSDMVLCASNLDAVMQTINIDEVRRREQREHAASVMPYGPATTLSGTLDKISSLNARLMRDVTALKEYELVDVFTRSSSGEAAVEPQHHEDADDEDSVHYVGGAAV